MKKLLLLPLVQIILIAFTTSPAAAQQVAEGWRLYRSAAKIMENVASKQDLSEAQGLLNEALKIFETEKSLDGAAQALYLIGCIQRQEGLYEAALESFEGSLNFTDRSGDMKNADCSTGRIEAQRRCSLVR